MRLIDKDEYLSHLTEIAENEHNKKAIPPSWSYAYTIFIEDVEGFPSVDAVSIEELLNMLNGRLDFLKKWRDATTDFKKIAKAKIEDCEEIIDIIKTYGFTDSLKDKEKTDETVCSKK